MTFECSRIDQPIPHDVIGGVYRGVPVPRMFFASMVTNFRHPSADAPGKSTLLAAWCVNSVNMFYSRTPLDDVGACVRSSFVLCVVLSFHFFRWCLDGVVMSGCRYQPSVVLCGCRRCTFVPLELVMLRSCVFCLGHLVFDVVAVGVPCVLLSEC